MSFRLFEAVKTNLLQTRDVITQTLRNASKKSGGSTRNRKSKCRPKHRGWKVQDGHFVPQHATLLTQFMKTRFHPGLNVGFGVNGTLYALCPGRVVVTCEKIDPNWDHSWIKANYAGREGQTIYKKHFNVIPIEPQHNRFRLIDEI